MGGLTKAGVGYSAISTLTGYRVGAFLYNFNAASSIGVKNDGTPYYNGYTLIHSGNIGDYTLKYTKLGSNNASTLPSLNSFGLWNEIGAYVRFGYSSSYNIAFRTYRGDLQTQWDKSSAATDDWKTIAFTDSNVASATKLQDNTAYTAWGQAFFENGKPKNVSGQVLIGAVLIGRGNNVIDGWSQGSGADLYLNYNSTKNISACYNGGNVIIGNTSDNGNKLQVNGSANFVDSISLYEKNEATRITQYVFQNIGRIYAYNDTESTYKDLWIGNNTGTALVVKSNGNVLIGTTTDTTLYKLDVNGTLNAGATTLSSLGVTNNATIGGTLGVTGLITGKFSKKVSWSGLYSGSYDGSADASFVIPSQISQLYNDLEYVTRTQAQGYVNTLKNGLADGSITVAYADEAGIASNLRYAPVLGIYGNKIAVLIGNKESEAITIPYATNAGYATEAGDARYATNAGYADEADIAAKININAAQSSAIPLVGGKNKYIYALTGLSYTNNSLLDVTGAIQATGKISTETAVSIGDNTNNYRIDKRDDDTLRVYGYANVAIVANSNILSANGYRGVNLLSSAGSITLEGYSGISMLSDVNASGNIFADGQVLGGEASDRRLKNNIVPMKDIVAYNVLKSLNPVTFEWNSTANQLGKLSGVSDGFIADEFEAIIPNSGRAIWTNYRAINYERTAGYLVKGWQMHETRLERLERENEELNNKVVKLENELNQYRRA
jgi:hypothetical protein